MAFGSIGEVSNSAPMAEINMIPLIDVMLVLLVIFIITAPLLTHAVKIDLPRASSAPTMEQPQTVQVAIKAAGEMYWNGERIEEKTLRIRLTEAIARHPLTELHIRADRSTPYDYVAHVMSAAAKAGLTRIGFITDARAEH